ncbi:enoyl-CoA hydratase/isomerase family protein [Amorphus sp. 3PC139-8]|uniref:enoyl-CoA hydratase/isomerase family protein n=1 Tax=Amorphus sp. 3PC139-8 TaxID=2735676 RepID=UPI00345E0176
MNDYRSFDALQFDRPADGVLRVTLDAPNANAVSPAMHRDLAAFWPIADRDESVRAVLLRGAGDSLSAGGSSETLDGLVSDYATRTRVMGEARDLVNNIVGFSKPFVSTLHGRSAGAALAAALLADVSVAARSATILDRHTRLGIAAGDHAVICWPLHVSMAKAKYHLLVGEPVDGAEAERIGLVSLCVDDAEVHVRSLDVAVTLADAPPTATRWTKQSLNAWYRAMAPAFDASLALEFYGFAGPEIRDAVGDRSKG